MHQFPYPGDFSVGIIQIETETSPTSKGVLGSLFFPTTQTASETLAQSKWLLGPHGLYSAGLLEYAGLNTWLFRSSVSGIDKTHIHALTNASLVPKDILSEMPVVVFSHGLVGHQTAYSQLVGTLASRGFLVLALEHRDGSAAASGRNNYAEHIHYAKPPGRDGTPPAIEFRKTQLEHRIQEVNEAFQLLKSLNSGNKFKNLIGSEVPDLTGRLDLNHSVLMGHSFGATTVIGTLQQPTHPFSAGIVLDPWTYPLRALTPVSTPLLWLQAEHVHRENLDSFKKIWTHPSTTVKFIQNSNHMDVTDFFLVIPKFLAQFMDGSNLEGAVVHRTNEQLELQFLKSVWGSECRVLNGLESVINGKSELGILEGQEE
ncbi:Platelet-activating factor acetylhydrolase, partial [Rhizoclosmatium hyalinum]